MAERAARESKGQSETHRIQSRIAEDAEKQLAVGSGGVHRHRGYGRGEHKGREPAGQKPLPEIENEYERAPDLSHGAEGVGGADVARPLVADVLVEGQLRDDDAPGNGA